MVPESTKNSFRRNYFTYFGIFHIFTGNFFVHIIRRVFVLNLQVKKGKALLVKVNSVAEDLGAAVYAVGGFVRDLYLGRTGTDIDFVVLGEAIGFAQQFKRKFHSGKVVTFPRFGTAMLEYHGYKLEFVSARNESYAAGSRKPVVRRSDLAGDLSRRDFTINTLALDITPGKFGEVIDLFNGLQDINNGLIKTPLDPEVTFNDDPLRILRAIRFAAVLNFKIDPQNFRAMADTRERLKIVSRERITDEFKKMMMAEKPSVGLQMMKESGLFPIIFPELTSLSGVEQRQDFHHKDVFNHTLQVVDNIARFSNNLELRFAALLHDIAKPQTKKFVEGTGWTFHGHEELGARMVKRIGMRMHLSLNEIKYIQKLVRLHLRPMQLVDDQVTDSAIRRLMVDAGEQLDDLMLLCRADITSKNPQKVKRYLSNFDKVEEKMKIVEEKDNLRHFKPAIDGNLIMQALEIPPGPLVGRVKQEIVDAILDGEIPNELAACVQFLEKIKNKYR